MQETPERLLTDSEQALAERAAKVLNQELERAYTGQDSLILVDGPTLAVALIRAGVL